MQLSYQQQLDLVAKGLATVKTNGNLSTFKYARKVMYDYLWDKHPELLNCRGQVYDNTTGQQVAFPPKKSFNYLENGTWKDKSMDTPVTLYKKYNGFMACVSVHNGEVVVSTTGTTNSDYAKLARQMLEFEFGDFFAELISNPPEQKGSWLFEICADSDPHIVYEKPGCYYLGYQDESGFTPINSGEVHFTTLGEALELAKNCKHEGYMMYEFKVGGEQEVCKLKSDYYVSVKKLMRANAGVVTTMYKGNNQLYVNLPELYFKLADKIVSKYNEFYWRDLSDQERRVILEAFVKEIESEMV